MTNKEFAELVHTGEGTVSRWVNGKQRPGKRRIRSIEHLLGVEPGTLAPERPLQAQKNGRRKDDPAESRAVRTSGANPPEMPDRVMLEFNRWLDHYLDDGGLLRAVDALEWMQRMWRASTDSAHSHRYQQSGWSQDPDIPLDIDVEPGTGIAITTNKGRLVVVNNALASMLESRPDEIVGRYVWELNAPEYTEPGKSRIRQKLTQPWDLELVTGSGNRIPVTVSNVHCHLRGNPVRVALVKRRSNGDDV